MTDDQLDLANMRVGYGGGIPPNTGQGDKNFGADGVRDNLDPSWLSGTPPWFSLARFWLQEAVATKIVEPNAMVLGTVDAQGFPQTRTVLCKGFDAAGVVFFTNYQSTKGEALAANPYAAVTFPWITLERQLHIRGAVVKVTTEESAVYWAQRPRGSQVSASCSEQSTEIESRELLERKAFDANAILPSEIPVPENWGGYRIVPEFVEFWQGRSNRLHNRVQCVLIDGEWTVKRVQP